MPPDYPVTAVPERHFRNSGSKACARCEAHLVYQAAGKDATRVMLVWADGRGERRDAHVLAAAGEEEAAWTLPTGKGVQTRWVEVGEQVTPVAVVRSRWQQLRGHASCRRP